MTGRELFLKQKAADIAQGEDLVAGGNVGRRRMTINNALWRHLPRAEKIIYERAARRVSVSRQESRREERDHLQARLQLHEDRTREFQEKVGLPSHLRLGRFG